MCTYISCLWEPSPLPSLLPPRLLLGLQDRFPKEHGRPAQAAAGPLHQVHLRAQESAGRRGRGPQGRPAAARHPRQHGQRVAVLGLLLQVLALPHLPQAPVRPRGGGPRTGGWGGSLCGQSGGVLRGNPTSPFVD